MMGVFGRRTALSLLILGLSLISSEAQTFKTLVIFNGANGATPVDTPLVQGIDGYLYGTTLGGGAYGEGTVFKISAAGKLTTIYSFCSQANCADGSLPYGGLALGSDGNFYGTTSQGGAHGTSGTVFKITQSGTLTTLHSFSGGTDGGGPMAPMIQGRNGSFYGITQYGGGPYNKGTIFEITPNGALTTLYDLGPSDGSYLNGPLVQASDGNFYGTTESGGANGYGTIFKITPSGAFSTLHSFNSTDGSAPAGGLVQSTNGSLNGTTYGGGTGSCPNGCGTLFKITLAGALTTLHNFEPNEPANPIAGLILGTDGNFYGTSYAGGTAGDWGTVFEATPEGKVTTLHSFSGNDGAQPYAPVSQSTNGNLYGTATNGLGADAQGTIFGIKTTLVPFVIFVRNTGKVGQTVGILGQGFSGTTSVSFNGTAAVFAVKSQTLLTTTVPAGATNGFVTVTTPTGTLKSNVPFRVLP